jgi:hypothetical protein
MSSMKFIKPKVRVGCSTTVVYTSTHPKAESTCTRSKAWLATSVWLRSRHLRDTLAASPGILVRALVAEILNSCLIGWFFWPTAV